jgi:hypothetical protein
MKPLISLLLLLVAFPADAATHALYGRVVDRNGEPLARVNVAVTPGNVEIITDETGRFRIDYLRDEKGERIRLARRTAYAFTFFKVGYHEARTNVEYKRGELELATVTLKEDTLELSASTDNLDPAVTTARDAASGGSYEGE